MKARITVDLPKEITPEKITHVCGAFWYKVNDEEKDFQYCTAKFELIEDKQDEKEERKNV